MLQLENRTPFAGTILLLPDADGVDSVYAIVKGAFTLGDPLTVADEQIPIAVAAEYHGEPDRSSIRVPSDISLMKPGADVLLMGHAYAPDGRRTIENCCPIMHQFPDYAALPPEPFDLAAFEREEPVSDYDTFIAAAIAVIFQRV